MCSDHASCAASHAADTTGLLACVEEVCLECADDTHCATLGPAKPACVANVCSECIDDTTCPPTGGDATKTQCWTSTNECAACNDDLDCSSAADGATLPFCNGGDCVACA